MAGFPEKLKTTSTKKIEPSTFHFLSHNDPMPHEGFPLESSSEATALAVLLIHGRLGLEEPFDDGIMAVLGCHKQLWCLASGATIQGQPQTEPNGLLRPSSCLKKPW